MTPRPFRVIKKRLQSMRRLLAPVTTLIERQRSARLLPVGETAYEDWLAVNRPSVRLDLALRDALSALEPVAPRISVIMPVYRPPIVLLQEAVESIMQQLTPNWQLCIADDGSADPTVEAWLKMLAQNEPRVSLITLPQNQGIAEATNAASSLATGEILVFLDQDDLLHPHCLAEIALYYARHPEADVVYSDHDKLDEDGRRTEPNFKPEWSPTLLLSHMYLGHVFSLRRSLFEALSGVRTGFDGAQDYDLALRATEQARHVGHIPRILYHWRVLAGSTAESGNAKPASFDAGRRAVADAIQRRGIGADVIRSPWAQRRHLGLFELRFTNAGPDVDILLPSLEPRSAERTLRAFARLTYRNFRLLVCEDSRVGNLAMTCRKLGLSIELVSVDPKDDIPTRLRGLAGQAAAPLLLIANGEITPLGDDMLDQLVGHHNMGAKTVGGRQEFDGRIVECGLIIDGSGDSPQPAFQGLSSRSAGYGYLALAARDCVVPGSNLLLVSRKDYVMVGGVSASLPEPEVCLIDLAKKIGGPSVVNPQARYALERRMTVRARRATSLPLDPFHNRNLARDGEVFRIRPTAVPLPSVVPIRTVFITHNLRAEGAPKTVAELAIGLQSQGVCDALLVSPEDGPQREAYQNAGVSAHILNSDGDAFIDELVSLLNSSEAEVLVANSLQSWRALEAATRCGIPSILWQHESEPWETYFHDLTEQQRAQVYRLIGATYRVTYVSQATRRAWAAVTSRNSEYIPNALPPAAISCLPSREDARRRLNLSIDETVIVLPGTVCRRKGQIDAIEAFGKLPARLVKNSRLVLVGAHPEPAYLSSLLSKRTRMAPLHTDRILLTGIAPDMHLWLAASDIVLCTSRIESSPRIILEAMAHERPIITTPVFGIPELLPLEGQAFFYPPGDAALLSRHMQDLLSSPEKRRRLAQAGHAELQHRIAYDDVLREYANLIREAAASR